MAPDASCCAHFLKHMAQNSYLLFDWEPLLVKLLYWNTVFGENGAKVNVTIIVTAVSLVVAAVVTGDAVTTTTTTAATASIVYDSSHWCWRSNMRWGWRRQVQVTTPHCSSSSAIITSNTADIIIISSAPVIIIINIAMMVLSNHRKHVLIMFPLFFLQRPFTQIYVLCFVVIYWRQVYALYSPPLCLLCQQRRRAEEIDQRFELFVVW